MVRIRASQARGPGSIPGRRKLAHLAQTVERWPFKPMAVGSIPTVGGAQQQQHKRPRGAIGQRAGLRIQRLRVRVPPRLSTTTNKQQQGPRGPTDTA